MTGTDQYGFQKPGTWDYCWTIQNSCGDILFNLTDWLYMEYAKDSGCDGYDDSKSSYYRNELTWDCDHYEGFKYKTCKGKDIYKDMVIDYSEEKRLSDMGPESGLYVVIDAGSPVPQPPPTVAPATTAAPATTT
ncbi:36240_t:CDS:2 [Racocetra persica]|uniref:36240_t:CDS:1 n=1 Tax=Racocetra persica TaxID=160502 RepID=A0ACA9LVF8_9GLOM|nr:36240_t:CDS:2 [Racocetra persica]